MEAHDKICFCFPLKRERVRRAGHGGSARGVAGVAAFSVPEQPHTAKPFLRLPEMTAGARRGGGGEAEGGGKESDLSAAAADMQTEWQLLQLNRVRQIGRSLSYVTPGALRRQR